MMDGDQPQSNRWELLAAAWEKHRSHTKSYSRSRRSLRIDDLRARQPVIEGSARSFIASLEEIKEVCELFPDHDWLLLEVAWSCWDFAEDERHSRILSQQVVEEAELLADLACARALEFNPESPIINFALAARHVYDACAEDTDPGLTVDGTRFPLLSDLLHARRTVDRDEWYADHVGYPSEPFDSFESFYIAHPAAAEEYVAERERALWESDAGYYVKRFLSGGGVESYIKRIDDIGAVREAEPYFEVERYRKLLLGRAWDVGSILPDEQRAGYYLQTGLALAHAKWVRDDFSLKDYFEEAVRWPATPAIRFEALTQLSRVRDFRPDFDRALQLLAKAVRATGGEWPSHRLRYIWQNCAGEVAAGLLKRHGVLPASPVWESAVTSGLLAFEPEFEKEVLGAVAEAAGEYARQEERQSDAVAYWEKALELNPMCLAAARSLAGHHLTEGNWKEALAAWKRVARLDKSDSSVASMLVLLNKQIEGTVSPEEFKKGLEDLGLTVTNQVRDSEASLRTTMNKQHEEVMTAFATSPDLFEMMRAEFSSARPRHAVEGEDEAAAGDALIDKLHNLIENKSQIQLARVQEARTEIEKRLGQSFYKHLHPDALAFLTTAEVFFRSSNLLAGAGDGMEFALIAVEYAKAVETQLRLGGYFHALETTLDRDRRDESLLVVPGLKPQERDSKTKSWKGVYTKQRDDESHSWLLDLGGIERFLRGSVHTGADNRLREYVRFLPFEKQWWRDLADDLKKVRKEYRNGGAHTEYVDYKTVVDFRKLLFEDRPEGGAKGGLLQRLAEISIATESRRPN